MATPITSFSYARVKFLPSHISTLALLATLLPLSKTVMFLLLILLFLELFPKLNFSHQTSLPGVAERYQIRSSP